LVPLVDRSVYPEAQYPVGQWDDQFLYEESFDKASAAFEANVRNTVKALFRKGNPKAKGKPSRTALVRHDGGWFGGTGQAPDLPMDTDVLTEEDAHKYAAALEANGFFGPDSWYMNRRRNLELAATAVNGGKLSVPVLFLHGEYDYTCETVMSRLAEPMRQDCSRLSEVIVASGHWDGSGKAGGRECGCRRAAAPWGAGSPVHDHRSTCSPCRSWCSRWTDPDARGHR
jgi:pimeloyl-ACP methyl ester carboxylesterase